MGCWKTRDMVFHVELAPHTSSPAVEQEEEDWRTVIISYLKKGKPPNDPREAHKLKIKCSSYVWEIDIVGPFPIAPAQKKFLLVAVDYFSKWVEAEPLARITENDVLKFLLKNISNGQVEVTNRTLVQGLKVRLGNGKGNWVDELPSVFSAYRTTPREETKETHFSLVYGNEAVLPAEIGLESVRVMFYDEDNDMRRATDLDLLEEKREAAIIRMEAYKNRIAQSYNRRVIQRNFQVGDLVIRKAQEEQRGKLDPKWEVEEKN
ncbi:uncharacterized protein [Primulina huaijiensis]|uniref:uncharacterized protein n=1 Tax=Primulina huaijiensis TaxID=1492673 RepID=UPI003CC70ACC